MNGSEGEDGVIKIEENNEVELGVKIEEIEDLVFVKFNVKVLVFYYIDE